MTIDDAIWAKPPAEVNAHIKALIGEIARTEGPQPEPGPQLTVTKNGLEIEPQLLDPGEEETLQRQIHQQLRSLIQRLSDLTRKIGNEHPEFSLAVSEYADVVKSTFGELDIGALWIAGAGLLAFSEAFGNPKAFPALSGTIDPATFALLKQAAQVHGGFILGFPLGRELVKRADTARLSPEVIEKIAGPSHQILQRLGRKRDFVSERARKLFASVDQTVAKVGWDTLRVGHGTYVLTWNSLIALGRFCKTPTKALLHHSPLPPSQRSPCRKYQMP